ncbi:hypothetical protein FH972_011946 [Carpinus fangiana]|uniref:Uncharacterized protein n=1 Tax=Carpinus fangiana TaxID=176857 RepID=A0A5N6R2B6_9ROSI|nr:hypothetical protein FH972_011946 [Carpinus fangiana]
MAHLDTGNSSASGPWQLNADCKFNGKKTPLMSHLNSGIFLPQYPSISQEIANSRTNIRFEGGLSTEVNLSVNSAENPLLPHLNPGIFLLQNPNISHEIANSRINIGFEGGLNREVNLSVNPTENLLMSHLNSGIFLPQDPSISVEIANSRTNIGSEGGLSAEVNYLRENPLMPDLLVSAAPSLDHPNQNYLGTPIDDDWEIIFYETPSPPLLPSSE